MPAGVSDVGSHSVKTDPSSTLEQRCTDPLCDSVIWRTIVSPSPVRRSRPVEGPSPRQNRPKILCWSSRAIPTPSSSTASFDKLETDATFAWVREEGGKVSKYAVREATSLKANGASLMQSTEPQTEAKEL